MNSLVTNSTAAERQRGIIFSETFESAAAIRSNGGVVSGALGFAKPAYGAYFDGANDYITYGAGVQPFSSGYWSAVIEFWPNFAANEATTKYFFDTVSGIRVFLRILNSGVMDVYAGTTQIVADSNYAVWSPYWRINSRNVIVLSCRTGASKIYLNGTDVTTNGAYAWSAATYSTGYLVGSGQGAFFKFQGYFKSVKFFRHNAAAELLTAQEAVDAYNQATYNYLDRAVCLLPLTAETHDPSHAAQSNDVPSTELVIDGSMEAVGTAAWTLHNAAILTKEGAPHSGLQCLRATYNGVASPGAINTALTVGLRYRATGWARPDGSGKIARVWNAAVLWQSTAVAAWQYFDVSFLAASSSFIYYSNCALATEYVEFDDCSVVETVNILSDGAMESEGVFPWTAGNTAVLTKSLVAPYLGLQSLQVAWGGVASPYAGQTVLTIGKRYHVSGVARGDTTYVPSILDGAVVLWTGTVAATWQPFSLDFTATTTGLRLQSSAVAAGNCCFDAVSVVEMRARTLDASGKGNHFLFGDGALVARYPTKLATNGYSTVPTQFLNGGTGAQFKPTQEFSFALLFKLDLWGDYRTIVANTNGDSLTTGYGLYEANALPGTVRFFVNNYLTGIVSASGLGTGNYEFIACTYSKSAQIQAIYRNGILASSAVKNADVAYASAQGLMLSSAANPPIGFNMTGNHYWFGFWPFALTPTQVMDAYRAALASIANV